MFCPAVASVGIEDTAADVLHHIYLMRHKIIEKAVSGNVGLYAPRQVFGRIVQIHLRLREVYPHPYDTAYAPLAHKRLYFKEIGQITPVVCHETRHSRLLRYAVHPATVFIACRHRLFHIHGFACLHRHYGIGGMGGRRSSYIDSIDSIVFQQVEDIVIPAVYAMFHGILLCFLLVAVHHGHHLGMLHHIEHRAAFGLGHFAASYYAPSHIFHKNAPKIKTSVIKIPRHPKLEQSRIYGIMGSVESIVVAHALIHMIYHGKKPCPLYGEVGIDIHHRI